MVIQRNDTLPIVGTARPGKEVTVRADWLDRAYTAKAGSDGAFRIDIPTADAAWVLMRSQ